eukprot:6468088-Amphidinium_carterae.1
MTFRPKGASATANRIDKMYGYISELVDGDLVRAPIYQYAESSQVPIFMLSCRDEALDFMHFEGKPLHEFEPRAYVRLCWSCVGRVTTLACHGTFFSSMWFVWSGKITNRHKQAAHPRSDTTPTVISKHARTSLLLLRPHLQTPFCLLRGWHCRTRSDEDFMVYRAKFLGRQKLTEVRKREYTPNIVEKEDVRSCVREVDGKSMNIVTLRLVMTCSPLAASAECSECKGRGRFTVQTGTMPATELKTCLAQALGTSSHVDSNSIDTTTIE